MNDRDKTVEFNPVTETNKEKVNRNTADVYSSARKNSYEQRPRRKSNDNKGLIYLAIFLTIALIVAIVVGIFVITNTNSLNNETDSEENISVPVEEEKEEEEEEIVNEENIYNIIFYGETVKKQGDVYTIAADLYDDNLDKVGSRKIMINSETVIKESGKRMSAEGFVYIIESLTGEMISVEGKIREADSLALTLSYDGSFREEMQQTEEEAEGEVIEGETPPSTEPENNPPTETPENQENPQEETQVPEETPAQN